MYVRVRIRIRLYVYQPLRISTRRNNCCFLIFCIFWGIFPPLHLPLLIQYRASFLLQMSQKRSGYFCQFIVDLYTLESYVYITVIKSQFGSTVNTVSMLVFLPLSYPCLPINPTVYLQFGKISLLYNVPAWGMTMISTWDTITQLCFQKSLTLTIGIT